MIIEFPSAAAQRSGGSGPAAFQSLLHGSRGNDLAATSQQQLEAGTQAAAGEGSWEGSRLAALYEMPLKIGTDQPITYFLGISG